MIVPEVNCRLYQSTPIPTENGSTYRLVCDYKYNYQFPGFCTFELRTAFGVLVSVTMNSGSGMGGALAAGGTFVGNGADVSPEIICYGDIVLDPDNGDLLEIEVDNISLKKIG